MTTEQKKPKTPKEFYALNFPPTLSEKHASSFIEAGGKYDPKKPSKLDTELSAMKERGERVLDIKRHGDDFEVTVMVRK
jgi:hypothetical protein